MLAKRVNNLKPEGAYQVLARAQELEAQGRNIIHFEIGEPDFSTPPEIARAGISAIEEGRTRYNSPGGIAELKEILAENAGKRRGMTFHPEQVVIAPGAKPNLFLLALAVLEPGDEVLYPDPGFPTYKAVAELAGAKAVPIPLLEETNFSFDLDVFDRLINDKTKMIILNSPANPTGGIIPADDLKHIAEKALRHNALVLSDEIYSQIVYNGDRAPSIAALPEMKEHTAIIDGFSKTFSMTGWRLGYGIVPKHLVNTMHLLLTHAVGCTSHFTQYAGIGALLSAESSVNAMLTEYSLRRKVIVEGLKEIPGMRCRPPQGAFYAFPNVTELGIPADELAVRILDEAGVALLPGTAFGEYGEGYLRISYCNSLKNIREGLKRIKDFVNSST